MTNDLQLINEEQILTETFSISLENAHAYWSNLLNIR